MQTNRIDPLALDTTMLGDDRALRTTMLDDDRALRTTMLGDDRAPGPTMPPRDRSRATRGRAPDDGVHTLGKWCALLALLGLPLVAAPSQTRLAVVMTLLFSAMFVAAGVVIVGIARAAGIFGVGDEDPPPVRHKRTF